MAFPYRDWPVVALNGAGVFFILMGLMTLALPATQEGILLWQIDGQHALCLMDVIGMLAMGMGLVLTWLGGQLWKRQLQI